MPAVIQTRLLALDLASQTGWALLASGVTDHGSISFHRKTGRKRTPDDHEGTAFLNFFKWLKTRLHEDKPEAIIYERPGFFKNDSAVNIARGMRGILYMTAANWNIPVIPYSPLAVKKWATGKGSADKNAMLAAAARLSNGDRFADDNAADAYLLLQFHLSK
jgi:Holliday junction resolvasome RuvABC endonuclease subunit